MSFIFFVNSLFYIATFSDRLHENSIYDRTVLAKLLNTNPLIFATLARHLVPNDFKDEVLAVVKCSTTSLAETSRALSLRCITRTRNFSADPGLVSSTILHICVLVIGARPGVIGVEEGRFACIVREWRSKMNSRTTSAIATMTVSGWDCRE